MDAATLAAAKAYANKRLNWRGAWAATTAYAKNDLVTYNGGLYRAPNAFTSGASFVIGNWIELVQQSGTSVTSKFRQYTEDVARLSPQVNAHQGYAADPANPARQWVSHTDRIDRLDGSWHVIAQNLTPLTGLTGCTHLGPIQYFNGLLYAPANQYNNVTAALHETIACFDATTLALVNHRDVSGDPGSPYNLSVCVRPEEGANGTVYGISYGDGSKLFKWDASTLAYVGTVAVASSVELAQGISYYNGVLYVASGRGHIVAIGTDGTVLGVPVRTDVQNSSIGSPEGLDATTGEFRWLIEHGGGTDRAVHFFTVPFDGAVTVGPYGQMASPAANRSAGLVLPGYGRASGVQFGEDRATAPSMYRINPNQVGIDGTVVVVSGAGGTAVSSVGRDPNGNPLLAPDWSIAPDLIRLGAYGSGVRDVNFKRVAAGVSGSDNQFRAADGLGTKDLGAIDGLSDAQVDAKFAVAPADGMAATATIGGDACVVIRRSGHWYKITPRGRGFSRRSGAIAETLDRNTGNFVNTVGAVTSGQLYVKSIELPASQQISNITFMSGGTAMASGTHCWFVLVDGSLNVLAKTADDTSGTWAANTEKTLALSAPYTPTTAGLLYVGVVAVATTMPTLSGISDGVGNLNGLSPFIVGLSTTGLTDPASLGSTIAALTTTARKAYAWVS